MHEGAAYLRRVLIHTKTRPFRGAGVGSVVAVVRDLTSCGQRDGGTLAVQPRYAIFTRHTARPQAASPWLDLAPAVPRQSQPAVSLASISSSRLTRAYRQN